MSHQTVACEMPLALVLAMAVPLGGPGAAAASPTCNVTSGQILGSTKAFAHFERVTPAECCQKCWATATCAGYNLEPDATGLVSCYLQADVASPRPKDGGSSAVVRPPAPPPQGPVVVSVGEVFWQTSSNFKSWNIDASANRGWNARNLSKEAPRGEKLWYLARTSQPGFLRFGGSGNNGLNYLNFCKPTDGLLGGCMNSSWFDSLMGFGQHAGAQFVFGLNLDPRNGSRWDPTQARAMMNYAIARNFTFFGFELGNEENPGHSAESEALDYQILHNLVVELYPDVATRPRLIGPDPHGFHDGNSTRTTTTLEFLRDFVTNTTALGVPMAAITHHEYTEVPEYSSVPFTGQLLDITGEIAAAVNATLAPVLPPGVGIWAGEIGPHNGGTVPCGLDRPSRWANFADVFWYLDAMASKAANGYAAFCRQDFVGIDYGLVDCLTYDPLPDYWAGLLWSRLMGPAVVRTLSSDSDSLRAWSHCNAASATDATLLLLNLDPSVNPDGTTTLARNVTLNVGGVPWTGPRTEYHLTGPAGTNSSKVALNGDPILLTPGGEAPPLIGRSVDGGSAIVTLAPASVAFVVLPGAGAHLQCTTFK